MSSPTPHLQAQEISDWFDNPITATFFAGISQALEVIYDDKANAHRATPMETQLRFEFLKGAEWAFTELLEYRDLKQLPVEVDDE